jgi:ABC-2 type transport system ATP-binding protein
MLNIKEISYRYSRRVPVLEGCSAAFAPGGIYGIVGANGVGKTTLLHLLHGFIFPKRGAITYHDHEPAQRDVAFLQNTAYVPVEVVLPRIKVTSYAARMKPFYPKFDQKIWENALKMLSIEPDRNIGALSFGQRKKVAIAFAIATCADLLLLDEPSDGLDIPSKDSLRRLLSTHADEGRTILITTHHIHDVAALLDHMVIMEGTTISANMSLAVLSERMHTTTLATLPPAEALLYSERMASGYHCLVRTESGQEGPLDLELLYKAYIANPQILADRT